MNNQLLLTYPEEPSRNMVLNAKLKIISEDLKELILELLNIDLFKEGAYNKNVEKYFALEEKLNNILIKHCRLVIEIVWFCRWIGFPNYRQFMQNKKYRVSFVDFMSIFKQERISQQIIDKIYSDLNEIKINNINIL